MMLRRITVLTGVTILIGVFILAGIGLTADPVKKPDPGAKDEDNGSPVKMSVKNPNTFLQYDGTGYRVVTKDPKPEKAGYVRLKPVTSKQGTFYVLEVIDDKEPAAKEEKDVDPQAPRLAIERVEQLDKKGSSPEPRKDRADIGVGVKVSESSEVVLGRGVAVEKREDKRESGDDAWRFKFRTNF